MASAPSNRMLVMNYSRVENLCSGDINTLYQHSVFDSLLWKLFR